MQPHPNVQAIQDALDAAGARDASGGPCQVKILPEAVHTAALAAAAIGIEVGQIANSLIFNADGEPLLVLTSGAHRVDTAKVAALLGLAKIKRADAEFVLGGVASVSAHLGKLLRADFAEWALFRRCAPLVHITADLACEFFHISFLLN